MTFDPAAGPSYWHACNPWTPNPRFEGQRTVDVAVVGGGMTGLCTAISLRDRGLSVAVLEAKRVGGAATGRNVGFILEGVAESYQRTHSLWGAEKARRARQFTVENHCKIKGLIDRFSIACRYRQGGSLHLAATEGEDHELREGTKMLLADGFFAEFVPFRALPSWAQKSRYRSGQIIPKDGELDPVAFAHGLAVAAKKLGADIYEDSCVTEIEARPDGVKLRTQNGQVSAAGCVLATNGYAGQLVPWLRPRLDPTRGQVLSTSPIDERLFERPIYASHGFEYWQQVPTGEVVMGGWRNLDMEGEVGTDNRIHDGIQATMETFLRGLHPKLASAEIQHRWAGVMGFSRDSLPAIGPLPGSPTLFSALGFTGHGFGFSAHAGLVVAELMVAGSSPWADLFAPRRLA